MDRQLTNAEKMRGLPWSIGFFATNAVWFIFAFTGSAFVLFLSQLGMSKTQIGALIASFSIAGLIALVIAPTVARWGYKPTVLGSYSGRLVATALLLLTPVITSEFGTHSTHLFITGVILVFAVSYAVGITALLPWMQEMVPDAIRGKYSALNNIFSSAVSFVAVVAAGYVLGASPELDRFLILFALAVAFGLVSLWQAAKIPGGKPTKQTESHVTSHRDIVATLKDSNFARYLGGVGLIALVAGPLVSFVPLFMQEEAGLSAGQVVLLQTGILIGGLLASYPWGWAADRYGSKPVMYGGIYLRALLPILWLLMPRHSPLTLYVALSIALFQGIADLSWGIGSGRLLFVSIVPPSNRLAYMALYFAWIGVIGGIGQLLGGSILDLTSSFSGQLFGIKLDPYTPLFLLGVVLPLLSALLLRRVRADSAVSAGEFAGLFLRGNPFIAVESMIRYHRAKDERSTVAMTERLGRTGSPLTVDELLEALEDPRFNVRFEAIVSIARRGPDDRLMRALDETLKGDDPALSVMAAWAMGRIGDHSALKPLREGLSAQFRSVQAHCARSLGTLNDIEIVPILLTKLEEEKDDGLRLAYAATLGQLRTAEATQPILSFLHASRKHASRKELALALGRIVGDEHHLIELLRSMNSEIGSAASRALTSESLRLSDVLENEDLTIAMEDGASAFGEGQLDQGIQEMRRIIRLLPRQVFSEPSSMILGDCAERLDEFGSERLEYVLLTLHVIHAATIPQQDLPMPRTFSSKKARLSVARRGG